jgi:hypothetical protein
VAQLNSNLNSFHFLTKNSLNKTRILGNQEGTRSTFETNVPEGDNGAASWMKLSCGCFDGELDEYWP